MRRRRSANAAYPVLCQMKTQRLRRVKRIGVVGGEAMVAAGKAVALFDAMGCLSGFRLVEVAPVKPSKMPEGEMPNVQAITAYESKLNAGEKGPSATAGLSEDERVWMRRSGLIDTEYDEVELAQVKVRTWREPSAPPRVHVVVPPARLHAA